MSRVLVTGSTGFLGHGLVRHLVTLGNDVQILARESSDSPFLDEFETLGVGIHRYRVTDEVQAIVRDIAPGLVFHLATHYLKDHRPEDVDPLIAANVTFGTQVLEALVGTEAVVVSTMTYFQFLDGSPRPFSLYSATKQAFLEVCDFYRVARGLDIRSVVLFDTYGPDDTRDKLIPLMVSAARERRPLSLGSPDQKLNLLVGADVARGLVSASEADVPPLVALRAPVDYSVREIAAMVGVAAGHELDVTFSTSILPNDLVTRSGRWPAPGQWRPEVALADGLAQCLAAEPAERTTAAPVNDE
jgi:nucleoside-diphosphate-sugar epimerase